MRIMTMAILALLIASCAEEKPAPPSMPLPAAPEYATATVAPAVPTTAPEVAAAPKPEPKYPSAGAPKFISTCVEMFRGESDTRFAYSRLFGWGEGKMENGKSFLWCSYSNSDAYIQLNVDARLSESQIAEIHTHKDKEDRTWDASAAEEVVGPAGGTWIGWTNDPALGSDDDPLVKSWEGDGRLVTEAMIEAMQSLTFIKSMTITELLR